MKARLSEAERFARLRLARSDNVGPATFRDLLQHLSSAVAALEALPELARRGSRKNPLRIASQKDVEREITATEAIGASLIIFGDEAYPPMLAALDPPPPAMTVKGDLSLLTRRSIAIVGSRNASAAGAKMSTILARDLGQQGFTIVSGLARGIDAAAHRASLDSGTIAVLGGGLNIVYPKENQALQEEIAERGLLVAEMPLHTEPRANLFPRRNRLISGLSLGVIVVEAALRSGSLITARYALEQGRDVFAVPGSPLDPRARGANSLIKQGAPLVENAEDIIAAFDLPAMKRLFEPAAPDFALPRETQNLGSRHDLNDSRRQQVIAALGPTPMQKDEIIRHTGLSASEVGIALIELAVANRLHRHTGDRVSLIPE